MQERARLLRSLSAEHLRHLARPFWRAGWRPADILHAVDHEPGGRPHGYTTAVRSPAAWIRARLAAWTGPDGTPLPSPGQLRAAAAARARADAAARREETARLAADRTPDNHGWADRARAMLTARGGTVARDLTRWHHHHTPDHAPTRPTTPATAPSPAAPPREPALPAWRTDAVAEQETAGRAAGPARPGLRWRDPAELARQQAAESRAARAGAGR